MLKNSKTFITVEEIKADLGTNENYIYDLLALQIIRNFKVGRAFRIKRESYEEFLNYCETHDLPGYEKLRNKAVIARAKRNERRVA